MKTKYGAFFQLTKQVPNNFIDQGTENSLFSRFRPSILGRGWEGEYILLREGSYVVNDVVNCDIKE